MSDYVPGQRPTAPWRFHHWWGLFATAATLPNCAAFTDTGYTNDVQRGDLAWADDTQQLYVCTDPTPGAAVWVPIMAVPGSTTDHIAPKYLVGNVPEGDSNVAYNLDGFRYIPDIGNGVGIQTALAAAALDDGDVWVRPGLYDFELGAITGALTVPAFCRLRGAGATTRIQSRATGNQGAFSLAQGAEVADMTITAPAPGDGAGTERGLVIVAGDQTFVRRVSLQTSPAAGALRYCISVQAGGGGTTRRLRLEDIDCNTTTTISTGDPTGALEVVPGLGACVISFSKLGSLGGDVSMRDPSGVGQGINQLIGEQLTLDEWLFAAVRWNGVGQITRLSMTTSGPNAAATACAIASRPGVPSTVLRDVYLDPKGAISVGLSILADVNGSVGQAPVIDGLTWSGNAAVSAALVIINTATARGAVIRKVFASQNVSTLGIFVKDSNPDTVIEDCMLEMLGTSGHTGILTTAVRTKVRGNTVSLLASGAGGAGIAIALAGAQSSALGNNVITANAADVGIDCNGNTSGNVVGNILDMNTDANAVVNVPATCNVAENVVV